MEKKFKKIGSLKKFNIKDIPIGTTINIRETFGSSYLKPIFIPTLLEFTRRNSEFFKVSTDVVKISEGIYKVGSITKNGAGTIRLLIAEDI